MFTLWVKNSSGASAIEYALIVAAVTLAISAAVFFLGDEVLAMFQTFDTNPE